MIEKEKFGGGGNLHVKYRRRDTFDISIFVTFLRTSHAMNE